MTEETGLPFTREQAEAWNNAFLNYKDQVYNIFKHNKEKIDARIVVATHDVDLRSSGPEPATYLIIETTDDPSFSLKLRIRYEDLRNEGDVENAHELAWKLFSLIKEFREYLGNKTFYVQDVFEWRNE